MPLPGDPRRDRARRSGRCGQSRWSRRMAIGRCRGAFQVDERWRGRPVLLGRHGPPRWSARRTPVEQLVPEEAGVPRPALRVQDLEVRAPPGRPVAVASDGCRAARAHDIPAQPDPALPRQLQAQPARLLDGGGQAATEGVGLQDHEERPRSPGQRRQPGEPIPHPRARDRRIPAVRKIHHQQVHVPGREERGREGEGLREIHRREHDEPLRAHSARDRLHGIERAGEVQPRDDRATRLRLGGGPQRDRRLARRRVTAQGNRGGARQPARAEDGVQRGEPGRDDAAVRVRV